MSEFASTAIGNAGLATGIIGTALGVLNGGAGLLGFMPNAQRNNAEYITKDTLDMAMKLAEKDSKIALLEAIQTEEIKIADVYERLASKINSNQREQDAINREQAVYNGVNTTSIGCLRNQIAELQGMTKTVIPADNVCPKPMPQFNSWTAPTT